MTVLLSDENGYIVKCDDCLLVEAFEVGSTEEFLETVNEYGWRAYNTKKAMKHRCPKCKRGEKNNSETD